MYTLILLTLWLSIICFFVVTGLCIVNAFGLLPGKVNTKQVRTMFNYSVIALLITVSAHVGLAFRFMHFNARPYIGIEDSIRNIQKALIKEELLKDYPGGVLGPNTFNAILEFQKKNKLEKSGGSIDVATVDSLFNYSDRPSSPINKLDPDQMRVYIKKPSFDRLQEQIKWFQGVLKRANCYGGPIDGILRNDILESVRTFQSNKGILVDGTIGYDTLLSAIEEDINRLDIWKRPKEVGH